MKAARSAWETTQALQKVLFTWLTRRWLGTAAALRRDVILLFAKRKRASAQAVTRDLNEMVHWVLIAGLFVSALLMLVGLGMDLWLHHTLPATVAPPLEAIRRAASLRPSGFLSLGLLVLILTPLLRVVGSLIVFARERDGRYVAVTALVLIVMLVSLGVGQA